MHLHELSPSDGSKKKKKRRGIGIGSGNGKTAGKGHKGQKARAGRSVSPYFEGGQMPLSRRIPKRGFSNFRFANRYEAINVCEIDKVFTDGDVVDAAALVKHKLISAHHEGKIKLLGNGELTKKVTVRVNAISGSARQKVESAGGSVEVI